MDFLGYAEGSATPVWVELKAFGACAVREKKCGLDPHVYLCRVSAVLRFYVVSVPLNVVSDLSSCLVSAVPFLY